MPSAERFALNEQLFRFVNDRIAFLSSTLTGRDEPGFVCECADMECTAQVRLSLAEYLEMREHDGQYVVLKGHELDPTIERVIRFYNEFAVVEKVKSGRRRVGAVT